MPATEGRSLMVRVVRVVTVGRRRVVAAGCALVVLVAGVLWWALRGPEDTRITAYFTEAVGVYPGSDLRVLGVRVGTIDSVTPQGKRVRVAMTLDGEVAVPAEVKAVVVAPSVVSDRYVQLTPAYSGGPKLGDGAVIPTSRTATPVELDQLYDSLNTLATALGPNGANADGALSDLLDTGAANLGGNGDALGTVIERLGAATATLSGSRGDLFATVDNLRAFTATLNDSDGQVRRAEEQLAEVSGFLADDREDLGAALNELATALGQVREFIQANRGRVSSNVDKLAAISQVLVDQRASLAEALDDIPLAVTNVVNAYDPVNGTLDSRGDLNELSLGAGATADVDGARGAPPGPRVVPPSRADTLPPLPLPAAGPLYGASAPGQEGGS